MTIASEQVNWNAQLRSLLSRVKESESAALFCHQNADPDATCSAFALQSLIQKLAPATSTKIVCPEGVSSSTKQLLENLGIDKALEFGKLEDWEAALAQRKARQDS